MHKCKYDTLVCIMCTFGMLTISTVSETRAPFITILLRSHFSSTGVSRSLTPNLIQHHRKSDITHRKRTHRLPSRRESSIVSGISRGLCPEAQISRSEETNFWLGAYLTRITQANKSRVLVSLWINMDVKPPGVTGHMLDDINCEVFLWNQSFLLISFWSFNTNSLQLLRASITAKLNQQELVPLLAEVCQTWTCEVWTHERTVKYVAHLDWNLKVNFSISWVSISL